MNEPKKPYLSYLLRLWVVKNQSGYVWRCSVEDVLTGKQHGFASTEALCDFLHGMTTHLPDVAMENNDCAV